MDIWNDKTITPVTFLSTTCEIAFHTILLSPLLKFPPYALKIQFLNDSLYFIFHTKSKVLARSEPSLLFLSFVFPLNIIYTFLALFQIATLNLTYRLLTLHTQNPLFILHCPCLSKRIYIRGFLEIFIF